MDLHVTPRSRARIPTIAESPVSSLARVQSVISERQTNRVQRAQTYAVVQSTIEFIRHFRDFLSPFAFRVCLQSRIQFLDLDLENFSSIR
jgi:hypothetical protein